MDKSQLYSVMSLAFAYSCDIKTKTAVNPKKTFIF